MLYNTNKKKFNRQISMSYKNLNRFDFLINLQKYQDLVISTMKLSK